MAGLARIALRTRSVCLAVAHRPQLRLGWYKSRKRVGIRIGVGIRIRFGISIGFGVWVPLLHRLHDVYIGVGVRVALIDVRLGRGEKGDESKSGGE